MLTLEDVIYIYARQLFFLHSAGATTKTHSSLDKIDYELCDLNVSDKQFTEETDTSCRYKQNSSTKKRKRNIESFLIDVLNKLVPNIQTLAPKPNTERCFF